jgi:hypothetical protein
MRPYQTPQEIVAGLEKVEPSIVEYIKTVEPLIQDVSFEYDFTTGNLMATVLPADGVLDPTLPLNGLVFYLHQVFDVIPGTFTYELVSTQKRTEYLVRIVVADEATIALSYENESSSSALFAGAFAVVFALYALF